MRVHAGVLRVRVVESWAVPSEACRYVCCDWLVCGALAVCEVVVCVREGVVRVREGAELVRCVAGLVREVVGLVQ